MTRALLIGKEPPCDLGFSYGTEDYEAVVIGSLSLKELLRFDNEQVLAFLAQGRPVVLYTPGLPEIIRNRALAAAAASAKRELKNWGVVFTDGGRRTLVTAEEARTMKAQGRRPAPGAVLTPLAREIMDGM